MTTSTWTALLRSSRASCCAACWSEQGSVQRALCTATAGALRAWGALSFVEGRHCGAHRSAHLLNRYKPANALEGFTEHILCGGVLEFGRLVRERDRAAFVLWLAVAEACGIAELRSVATFMRRAAAAIVAALTLPWSNGQTEGQVTRLK